MRLKNNFSKRHIGVMRYVFPILFCSLLCANPGGHTVMHGDAQIAEQGNLMEVTTPDRAVIHWDSFSIQAGETTRFIQPSIDSAVLNKVIGSELSQIHGLLQSNGQVYLVNPNGVLIGPEGRIDTAAFMATALDIQSGEFLSGEALELFGDSMGKIVNLGTIETSTGPVALIGHRIENAGEIHAPTANLLAGHSVLFDPTGDSLLYIQPDLKSEGIDMSGRIDALKTVLQADTPPTTLAIGLGGIVDATTIECIGGEIYLTAGSGNILIDGQIAANEKIYAHAKTGTVENRGSIASPAGEVRLLGKTIHLMADSLIDASGDNGGGTVLVGGDYQGSNPEIPNADYVYCDPTAHINVDAKKAGDGGKAIFWGDEAIAFYGNVNARGGPEGGNGGFVEVSSPKNFSYGGLTNTLAPCGNAGTLLLDPTTINISSAATAGGSFSIPPPPFTFSGAGPTATLNDASLTNQLALGNVIIDSTAGAGGTGFITVDAGATVSWSANTLTFMNNGLSNPEIAGVLNVSGTGGLVFTAAQDIVIYSTGIINYGSNQTLNFPSGFFICNGGTINVTSDANVNITVSEGIQFINGAVFNCSGTGLLNGVSNGLNLIQITDSSIISNGSIAFQNVTGAFSSDITITNSTIAAGPNGNIFLGDNNASANIIIDNSSVSTGNGFISFVAVGAAGEVYLLNNSSLTTGTGGVTFAVSGAGNQLHLNGGVTITSASSLTLTASTAVNLNGTINLNTPQPVEIRTSGGAPAIRGASVVFNTTSSLLTFPFGINSSLPSQVRDLTINSTYGNVSFGGNCTLSAANINAGGNIDITGTFDVQRTDLSLNAGGNINLNSATVQGVNAVSLIAGSNIVGNGSGLIQTVNANDLFLVSDHQFPSSPNFGTGVFQLENYTLQTNSGLGTDNNIVFLYTSTPTQYITSPITGNLPSTINGLGHTFGSFAGTTFNKGTNEFLFTYFPNLPVDPPSFELIFKSTGISPATIQTIEVAVTEPVSNPPQITQVTEGNLSTPSTPSPTTPCRAPSVAVQAI